MAFWGIGKFIDAVARKCAERAPPPEVTPVAPEPTGSLSESLRGLEQDAEAAAEESLTKGGELYVQLAIKAHKTGALDDVIRLWSTPGARSVLRARNEDAVRALKDAAVALATTDITRAAALYGILIDAQETGGSYGDLDAFIEYSRLEFLRGAIDNAVAGLGRAKVAFILLGQLDRASWCAVAQVAIHLYRRDLAAAETLLANEGQRRWFTENEAAAAITALIQAVKGGTDPKKARWALFGVISDSDLIRFGFAPEGEPRNLAWIPETTR